MKPNKIKLKKIELSTKKTCKLLDFVNFAH